MKKTYQTPATGVINIQTEAALMTVSGPTLDIDSNNGINGEDAFGNKKGGWNSDDWSQDEE